MSAPTKQSDYTFQQILDSIYTCLEERDWHEQDTRSLAISISLEAAELLEHYQWSDTPVGSKEDLASELADILIYAFNFASREGIDIPEAILAKLEKQKKKYPAEDFKHTHGEDTRKAWLKAKLRHQKEGL